MFEPEELMARIVDLEAQLKVSEMAPPSAEQLIACLEGEIAKRDEELAACRVAVENCDLFRARIAELEAQYQRDVCGLNNEGDPIGGDPAGGYANDNARLRSELAAIKAREPGDHVRALNDALTFGIGMIELNSDGKSEHVPAESIYAAPAAPAADAGASLIEWTKDAVEWGGALNYAAWEFVNECPEKSALLFNNTKRPLRAAIIKYAEIVSANAKDSSHDQ